MNAEYYVDSDELDKAQSVKDWNGEFSAHQRQRDVAINGIKKRCRRIIEQLDLEPDNEVNPDHWRALVSVNDHLITITLHFYASVCASHQSAASPAPADRRKAPSISSLLPTGIADFSIFDQYGGNVSVILAAGENQSDTESIVYCQSNLEHLRCLLERNLSGQAIDMTLAYKLIRMGVFELAVT